MKPIRIAYITTVDMMLRHVLFNHLMELQRRGYEVTAISAAGPNTEFLKAQGIRHIAVPMTRRITPVRDLRCMLQLFRVMRRERFDVVHTHNPKPGLIGQLAARAAGVPIVVNTIHGFYLTEQTPPLQRAVVLGIEKVAALCSDRIFSVSGEDVETAVRAGVCRREKIQQLGVGIDLERFDPATVRPAALEGLRSEFQFPAGVPIAGFVGRLVEEKGVLDLLEAARRVRDRGIDFRLLLIGPVDEEKKDALTPEVIGDFGLEDVCVATGMRYDLPELYALMDVFVLASYREGFPLSVMEACAMGTPVITTDVRGCREAIENGVTGLVVPPGAPSALADALEALLTDGGRRAAMGRAARQAAQERFDERRHIDRLDEAYRLLFTRSQNKSL